MTLKHKIEEAEKRLDKDATEKAMGPISEWEAGYETGLKVGYEKGVDDVFDNFLPLKANILIGQDKELLKETIKSEGLKLLLPTVKQAEDELMRAYIGPTNKQN